MRCDPLALYREPVGEILEWCEVAEELAKNGGRR
jgi:hypothetical protein